MISGHDSPATLLLAIPLAGLYLLAACARGLLWALRQLP